MILHVVTPRVQKTEVQTVGYNHSRIQTRSNGIRKTQSLNSKSATLAEAVLGAKVPTIPFQKLLLDGKEY